MYKTNIACEKAGNFEGPTVVSMRPMTPEDAIRAIQITTSFPDVHGYQSILEIQVKLESGIFQSLISVIQ